MNLVPNYSFEHYDSCHNFSNGLKIASPWFPARQDNGSSDYFNACSTPSSGGHSVPNNFLGHQYANTGDGYAGIIAYVDQYREYLEVQLTDSMLYKKRYCVQFYVSLADSSKYAINRMGAYFSQDSLLQNQSYQAFSIIPHVSNLNSNILNDTTNWVLISGYYTANGGERFITIGNFYNDSNTVIDTVNNLISSNYMSYYYIDDVSVILCDSTNGITDPPNNLYYALVYPNPASSEIILNYSIPIGEKGVLRVFNSIGKMIDEKIISGDDSQAKINLSSYAESIYNFSITGNIFSTIHGRFSVVK